MIPTGLIGTVIVLSAAASAIAGHRPIQHDVQGSSAVGVYQEFMALPTDQRREQFAAMSPENKARVMRTHVERWIEANRRRLTAPEIAVFEEMVAYITPDIYRRPPEAALDKREEELRAKMKCRVSPEDVRAATNLSAAAAARTGETPPSWNYLTQAKCWVNSFLEGVVDYIPR